MYELFIAKIDAAVTGDTAARTLVIAVGIPLVGAALYLSALRTGA